VDFVGTFTGVGDQEPDDADQLDLDHQAIGGGNSRLIHIELPAWLTQNQPDVALVYLGINDFYDDVPPEETLLNLDAIIDLLRQVNPQVQVLLAQIMPGVGVESEVAALNYEIAELAARLDSAESPIEVVDMASGVDVERDLIDGVHPSDEQSSEMASRWAQALTPRLGDACQL
jgi:acyl-CoA thioesterase-1